MIKFWNFYNKVDCLAEKPFTGSLPSNRTDSVSSDAISFSKVDIVTPAQKLMARQLTCDIVPGKSLLVTGWLKTFL